MRVLSVPAVSVAVIHNGRVDWARAWGFADVEAQRPATPATMFQAASMSKSVGALAALTLVESGVVSLDDDVNDGLRSWKVPASAFTVGRPVTLRGLLSHTAGTTVHGFPGYAPGQPVPTAVQVLDAAGPTNTAAVRVDTLPGALWRYSGGGYTIAQLLLSDATGSPYEELVQQRVLEPLGMSASTSVQPLPDHMRAHAATAYRSLDRPVAGLYHTYPEMAAAGLWTTPSDYARFVLTIQQALRGEPGAIVSQATARAMLTPVMNDYGLGVGVSGSGDSLRFSHGGANAGFRSTFVGFAGTGSGIVVMTNSDTGGPLANEIVLAAARVYGWPGLAPTVVTPIAVEPAALETYTGTYRAGGTSLVVTRTGDRLMLSQDGAPPLELVPTATDAFMYLGAGVTLRFERSADGAIVALRAGSARAERVER
jgi:CubicO group peptidase (beta-lactamase class C family)